MKRFTFWLPLCAILMLTTVLAAALLHGGGNPEAVATPLAGQAAPTLDVPMLDSHTHITLDSLRGKPHLLNFFASWCGPCAEENPVLLDLAQQHKIAIVGVALKDNAEALTHYLSKRGNPYDAIGIDEFGSAAIDWGVTGVPETFAIDKNGRIIDRTAGAMSEEDATRMVNALLHPAQ